MNECVNRLDVRMRLCFVVLVLPWWRRSSHEEIQRSTVRYRGHP